MRSFFEVIPLIICNFIFVLIFNIYESVATSSLYFSFWLVLTLAQFGFCAVSQCITLLSGPNFSMAIVVLSGTFFLTIVVGGAYVPLSQLHYVYQMMSFFSIPRFSFHIPMLLQYGFGRCVGKEVSSMLYMLELDDQDYLPNLGLLLFNVVLYRLLALYLLIRQVNPVENRKKRVARIVQHQVEMTKTI